MNDLIDTTEMYLRTIYELMEEGITPLRARIAERLHQSGPTVSQTVARMERDGLLTVHDDRRIELSAQGEELAVAVMRKHRLAERLLVDVIGLEWEQVHDEACRWEHVISDDVERRLVDILADPHESPYGNPIPGLGAIGGTEATESFRDGLELLAQVAGEEPCEVVLRRMSEYCQAELETLQLLAAGQIRPGAHLVVQRVGQHVRVQGPGEAVDLARPVAEGLFVSRVAEGLFVGRVAEGLFAGRVADDRGDA